MTHIAHNPTSPVPISWTVMERLYVGKKYQSRINIPGYQTKTVKVVDVNLGGDVAIRYRGAGRDQMVSQYDFLEWVKTAKVLEEPKLV